MKFLIFIVLLAIGAYFLKDNFIGKIESDFQKVPMAVQEHNEKIYGQASLIKDQKLATEVDAVCKTHNKWKYEKATKDIFAQNCLDATISLR